MLGVQSKETIFFKIVSLRLPGNDLLSQDSAVQVSWALEVLTSVFGMDTGGTPPALSPDRYEVSVFLNGTLFPQNYTDSLLTVF